MWMATVNSGDLRRGGRHALPRLQASVRGRAFAAEIPVGGLRNVEPPRVRQRAQRELGKADGRFLPHARAAPGGLFDDAKAVLRAEAVVLRDVLFLLQLKVSLGAFRQLTGHGMPA